MAIRNSLVLPERRPSAAERALVANATWKDIEPFFLQDPKLKGNVYTNVRRVFCNLVAGKGICYAPEDRDPREIPLAYLVGQKVGMDADFHKMDADLRQLIIRKGSRGADDYEKFPTQVRDKNKGWTAEDPVKRLANVQDLLIRAAKRPLSDDSVLQLGTEKATSETAAEKAQAKAYRDAAEKGPSPRPPPPNARAGPACKKAKTDAVVSAAAAEEAIDSAIDTVTDGRKYLKMQERLLDYQRKLLKEEEETGNKMYSEVRGVYLGRVHPYTNMKEEVSTTNLQQLIDEEFKFMKPKTYEFHPLRDFYEKCTTNPKIAYLPVEIRNKKTTSSRRMGEIDHVLTNEWSLFNHPRFYMYVNTRFNSHMKDNMPPEYRIGVGMNRSELLEMKNEVQRIKALPSIRKALAEAYKTMVDKPAP
jgi:hypothetical protein